VGKGLLCNERETGKRQRKAGSTRNRNEEKVGKGRDVSRNRTWMRRRPQTAAGPFLGEGGREADGSRSSEQRRKREREVGRLTRGAALMISILRGGGGRERA